MISYFEDGDNTVVLGTPIPTFAFTLEEAKHNILAAYTSLIFSYFPFENITHFNHLREPSFIIKQEVDVISAKHSHKENFVTVIYYEPLVEWVFDNELEFTDIPVDEKFKEEIIGYDLKIEEFVYDNATVHNTTEDRGDEDQG